VDALGEIAMQHARQERVGFPKRICIGDGNGHEKMFYPQGRLRGRLLAIRDWEW